MRSSILALLALVTAAGAADARPDPAVRGEADLAKALRGRIAGKPVNCIPLTGTDGPQIYAGTALVYRVNANTLYVNRPANARTLRNDDLPVVRVFGGQLCRRDQVRLLDRLSRIPRGFILLGDFVPYRLPSKTKG
jgi:hypothetical protein